MKFPLGGIPMGQLSCIGAHSSTTDEGPKSNFAGHMVQQAILQGMTVLYINTEATIDDAHFKHLGSDNK